MKRLLCALLLVCSLLTTAPVFSQDQQDQEGTKEAESLFVAQKAFDDGFYDVALSLLERFIKNYPASDKIAEINLLIARCYFQQNRFLEALKQFESLQNSPSARKINDVVLYWIAEVHFRGNNFSRAAGYYKQVIDGFPGSPYAASAYYSLGWCLSQQGQYKEALDNFLALQEKFPGEQQSRDAEFKIIECLYNLKEYARLKERINSRIKDSKDEPSRLSHLYYYLAEAEYYLDDYAAAADDYGRSGGVSDDPKIKALAKLGLGWARVKQKKYAEAQEAFAAVSPEALDKPYQEIYHMGRAVLAYETGRFAEAQEYYGKLKGMTQDPAVSVQASLGAADSLYSRGEYAEAVKTYREVAADAAKGQLPQEMLDRLHHSLAWAYLKEGLFKEAIAEFQKIANQSEDKVFKVSALCQIGDTYQDSGDNVRAREAYEKILREFPGGFYADYVQYQLGIVLIKLADYDAAILNLLTLKKTFPESKLIDDAQYALGLAYFQKKDYGLSLETFRVFEKNFRDSELFSQAMYLCGTSLFNLGQYAQAIEVFKDIIRRPNSDKDILQKAEYEIADCYYQMGDEKEAMARFNQLRVKYPDSSLSAEIMWWLGEYYYRKDDLALAIRYFSSLINDFKDSSLIPNAYYAIGSIYAEEGKLDAAEENFRKVVRMSGAELGGQASIAIADIYARQEKSEEALKMYRDASAEYPQLAPIIYPKLGDLFAQQNRYEEALASYGKALDAVPLKELPSVHMKMAEVFQSQGKTDEAVEHYLKITYLFPEDRELGVKAMLRVAKIREEQGNKREAEAMYGKIAGLDVAESKFARERLEILGEKSGK